MIKILAISMLSHTLLWSGIAFYYFGQGVGASVAFGGVSILLNVLGLATIWRLIFLKKSIALVVSLIIFKYLLLAVLLWSLWTIKSINVLGFCVGLTSLLFGCLVLPLAKAMSQKKI